MPDIIPTLDLREVVYYEGKPFYIVSHKVIQSHEDNMNNKVVYQISQDLPNSYGLGRGVYPNVLITYDREDLLDQDEFDEMRVLQLESKANNYELTLTGLPIITLNGEMNIKYVFDGTNTYPWDGEAFPPYDILTALPIGTIWDDEGGHVTDQEDSGHGNENIINIHMADISWDGNAYIIDNSEFTLFVDIKYTSPDDIISVVPNVNLSVIGTYEITYEVFDSQRIHSYPIIRTVLVSDVPVPPQPTC